MGEEYIFPYAQDGMSQVWIALIVAISSMGSPLLMAFFTNRYRKQEKLEDYVRQDEVAARLLKQQNSNTEKMNETSVLLKENTEAIVVGSNEMAGQLKAIHTLVNSSMTSSLEDQLDARVAELVLMKEIVGLKNATGQKSNGEALAVIKAAGEKIVDLRAVLAERKRQTEVADQQVETAEKKAETAEKQADADT